jgi:hypothetical protein
LAFLPLIVINIVFLSSHGGLSNSKPSTDLHPSVTQHRQRKPSIMPSLIDDLHDWPLDGAPISNDFRAQNYTPEPGRSRHNGSRHTHGCKICEAYATCRHNRYYRKSDAVNFANAVEDGKHLAATTLVEQYDGAGFDQLDTVGTGALSHDDAVVAELWRLGLLYDDAQERGAGVSLDVITHDDQEFCVLYKPLKGSRRRRYQRMAETPVSPALSFVDITSDEELAAFLSVYDFVDVGAESSLDENFDLV